MRELIYLKKYYSRFILTDKLSARKLNTWGYVSMTPLLTPENIPYGFHRYIHKYLNYSCPYIRITYNAALNDNLRHYWVATGQLLRAFS